MSFCRNCGNEIPEDGTFCPSCGAATVKPQAAVQAEERESAGSVITEKSEFLVSPKNRTCALILAIIFGPLGVQNFYLGKTSRALGQLIPMILGSFFLGISSVIMTENVTGGVFLYLIALVGVIIPTVTSIIDIVNIAKGTAEDGKSLLVKNWGNSSSAAASTATATTASVNEKPALSNQGSKSIVEKLFFLFPIVIGLIAMYTRADNMDYEYYRIVHLSTKYVSWSLLLVYAIMAIGTFGFGFDFKKGIFMGLGASVGAFPVFKMYSWALNACIKYPFEHLKRHSYYDFGDLLEDVVDMVKKTLAQGNVWTDYLVSVFVFFAVAVAMAFIAKAVRKYNENKAKE